jgi:hypothetical protein
VLVAGPVRLYGRVGLGPQAAGTGFLVGRLLVLGGHPPQATDVRCGRLRFLVEGRVGGVGRIGRGSFPARSLLFPGKWGPVLVERAIAEADGDGLAEMAARGA